MSEQTIRPWAALGWSALLQMLTDNGWTGVVLFFTSYTITMGLLYLWEPLQRAERWCNLRWMQHENDQDELRRLGRWKPVPLALSIRIIALSVGELASAGTRGLLIVCNLIGHPIMLAVAVLS